MTVYNKNRCQYHGYLSVVNSEFISQLGLFRTQMVMDEIQFCTCTIKKSQKLYHDYSCGRKLLGML